ncbi:MAG TPA: 3-deoxy-7-phosphoheptulonate synthase, partial [Spongiibacteraceae bacterium]|nr:3-deoxy-7-phosphoheptulonate synthase [Spongiibacteraceae bacterium]
MLIILRPDCDESSDAYQQTLNYLQALAGIRIQRHDVQGQRQKLTELYLIGNTAALDRTDIEALPAVERVVRISEEYRIL